MTFPADRELDAVAYQFLNCSEGLESQAGRWASGPSPDGPGEFEYVAAPEAMAPEPELGQVDPRLHGTRRMPLPPSAS